MSSNNLSKLFQSHKQIPTVDNNDLPNCYYHRNSKIHYFCLNKECTVPLCDDCKRIHKKDGKTHNIIKYQIAKKQALQLLKKQQILIQNVITILSKSINRINQSLKHQKQQILKQVDSWLQQIKQNLVIKQKLNILKDIVQQHKNITSGSIKPLIQFYIHQKPTIKLTDYHFFIDKFLLKDVFKIQQKQIISNTSQTRKQPYSSQKEYAARIQTEQQSMQNKLKNSDYSQVQENNFVEMMSKSYDKKKRKGLSIIYSSQKNLQKIKRFTPLKKNTNEENSWKKVVKMSSVQSNSASRLIIQRINYHNQYQNLISPSQLIEFCKGKQHYLQNEKRYQIKLKSNQSQSYIPSDYRLIQKQGLNDGSYQIKLFKA